MASKKTKAIVVGGITAGALVAAVAAPGIAAALPSPAGQVVQDGSTTPDDVSDAPSHGAEVSAVARDKSGDVTNHGQRVSEVARQNGLAHRADIAEKKALKAEQKGQKTEGEGNPGNAYGHDKGVGNPHGDY